MEAGSLEDMSMLLRGLIFNGVIVVEGGRLILGLGLEIGSLADMSMLLRGDSLLVVDKSWEEAGRLILALGLEMASLADMSILLRDDMD